jgi:mRNA interferase RelE/StbE
MTDVRLSERAVERLNDLDGDIRDRVRSKLREAGDQPEHFLEPLRDEDAYKLRVGDYRVIVDWDREDGTLYVLTLGHRRNVYDREF